MKLKIIAMMAALSSAPTRWQLSKSPNVRPATWTTQSLGVIYINHNMATEHEAEQALSQMSDAQGRNTFSLS